MSYNPEPFKYATNAQVGRAMASPILPEEQLQATQENAKRQQLYTALPSATNTNPMGPTPNKMGAQPIGEPPQPPAGLAAATPAQPNPIQMALGGIVPYDHAVDGPKIVKYLEAEVDRRAKGGVIKFNKGGNKGLQSLLALASGQGFSQLSPEELLRLKAEEEARKALVAQIPGGVPPATARLAAQGEPYGTTGDPYLDDPKARQNPATWLADQYVEEQKQKFNTPAVPAAAGIASVLAPGAVTAGRISPEAIAAGTAEQAAAQQNPNGIPLSQLGVPINGDPNTRLDWRGKTPPTAAQLAMIAQDIAGKQGAPAGGTGSGGISGGSATVPEDKSEWSKMRADFMRPQTKAERQAQIKEELGIFREHMGDSGIGAMRERLKAMGDDKADIATHAVLGAIRGGIKGGNIFGNMAEGAITQGLGALSANKAQDLKIGAEEIGLIKAENDQKRAEITAALASVRLSDSERKSLQAQLIAMDRADQRHAEVLKGLEVKQSEGAANRGSKEGIAASRIGSAEHLGRLKGALDQLKSSMAYKYANTANKLKQEQEVATAVNGEFAGTAAGAVAPTARDPIPYEFIPGKK